VNLVFQKNSAVLGWLLDGVYLTLTFLGYSANGETIKEAKCRAERGAELLENLAKKQGSVLLVGHGFLNRFIAKRLISNGWKGPSTPGRKYWAYGVYEYTA